MTCQLSNNECKMLWHNCICFYGFGIFVVTHFTIVVFSLHCHKCDTEQHMRCANALGSDKYLQVCPDNLNYCTMIWTKERVLRRGCTDGKACDAYKIDDAKYCCDCQQNGCNWGRESCNSQIKVFPKWTIIVGAMYLSIIGLF